LRENGSLGTLGPMKSLKKLKIMTYRLILSFPMVY